MGPKDQYECPIDLVADREHEKQNELFQLTYLFQISEWTLENGDHDDGDGDGMFDDDVLFWIWSNLMLYVFPVCHHLLQPAPQVGLLTVDEVRRSFLELRLGLLPELLK
jgi:hypothetical protein